MKKRQIEVAVLSNIHLGAEACRVDALRAYLNSIAPKTLVLNGIFIEQQAFSQSVFPASQYRIFKKLLSMASEGTKIYFVYPSEDPIFRTLKDKALENVFFTKNLLLDLDGKKAWFTHGDFLESSLFSKKWVHWMGVGRLIMLAGVICMKNKFWNSIGQSLKSVVLHPESDYENRLKEDRKLQETTVKLAIGRGCEYLVCGAPHRLSNLWLDTRIGKCQYLSAGDWVENLTALEYNFKRWKAYRYSEDKLSPFFADEDLKQMNEEEILSKNFRVGPSMAG